MANRHGFICGATGTGKTVTLKVLAESFSAMGVPVSWRTSRGDLSGMSQPVQDSADMQDRAKRFALAEDGFAYQGFPTQYFDIYGKRGIPLRTTVSEIGPQLLAGILGLNKTQATSFRSCTNWRTTKTCFVRHKGPQGHPASSPAKTPLRWRASTAALPNSRWRPSCAPSSRWRAKARTSSSASPRSTWRISSRPTLPARGTINVLDFQQPHQPAAAVFCLYALPAVRAVRGPARSGGYGQAPGRVFL